METINDALMTGPAGPWDPRPEQETIGMLPRVRLRLGRLSPRGEQKGVDLRIGLDLALQELEPPEPLGANRR